MNQHCVMQAEVSEASSGNPGIPPSSLMSFLRVKRAISGEVPLHTLNRVAVVPPPLLLMLSICSHKQHWHSIYSSHGIAAMQCVKAMG